MTPKKESKPCPFCGKVPVKQRPCRCVIKHKTDCYFWRKSNGEILKWLWLATYLGNGGWKKHTPRRTR